MAVKLDGDTEKRIHLLAGKLGISYVEAYRKIVGVGLFVFETKEVLDKVVSRKRFKENLEVPTVIGP